MDDWRQWHSVRSGVYYFDIRCRTGNHIEEEYLVPGSGDPSVVIVIIGRGLRGYALEIH
jgi:hypothetical protein